MQVVRVEDFFIQEEVKWNLSSRHGLLIYKLYEQVLPEHERDFLEEIEAKYVQDEALLLFRVEQHKQEKDYTLAEAKLLRHLDISHNYYSPDYKVLLQLFELADIQNEAEKKKKYADLIFQKDTKLENYKRLNQYMIYKRYLSKISKNDIFEEEI